MPEFVWRAAQADGTLIDGRSEGSASAAVLRQLRERGLTPIRIDDAESVASASPSTLIPGKRSKRAPTGPVNQADILALTSELSIMLRAGLALDNALRVLIDMSHKASVKSMLSKLLEDVKGGSTFSRALGGYRTLFGDFYINMIRSGEISGQMSQVLERLVDHMERLRALRESVISATIYPAILLAVAALSLVAMLGFVVPQFEQLFTDMGDALPLPTRIVMVIGHAFRQYGLPMLAVAVFLGWLAMRWLRSPSGGAWAQSVALRLPMVGSLLHQYHLTLFARSLGTLLGNGVPMLTAMHIATETVANQRLRQPLADMIPIVKNGGRVVTAMSATGIFEPLAINLVRVGEETGRIGPMMIELANILNRDVETGIKRALTFLEPVLILVLGIMIATIIVSILLGILSINDLAR